MRSLTSFLAFVVVLSVAAPVLASYQDIVLGNRPEAYWRLGEASGATAYDSSGNGHTATYTGVVLAQPGGILGDPDTSVYFSSGNKIKADSTGLTPGLDPWTVEAWVKAASTGKTMVIVSWYPGGSYAGHNSQYILGIGANGTPNFQVRDISGSQVIATGTTPITDAQWHHVAGVLDRQGGNVLLYVDATAVAAAHIATLGSITDTGITVNIGYQSLYWGSAWAYEGMVDEVAMYRSALSAAQIQLHHAGGTGMVTDSDGDGVPDALDKCPGSPPGAVVDSSGCIVQCPSCQPQIDLAVQNALAGQSSLVAQLNATISSLNADVNSLTATVASRDQTIASLQSQIAALQSQVAPLQTQVASLQTQIASLQSQLAAAQSQLATAQSQLATAQSQLAAAQSQIGALNAAVADRDATITALNAQVTALKASLADRDQTIAQLQQQVAALNANIATLNATISAKDQSIGQLQQQIDALNANIATLNASLTAKDQSISQLQQQVASLSATIATLNAAVTAKDQSISQLQQQVAGLTATNATLSATISAKDQTIAGLNAQVGAMFTKPQLDRTVFLGEQGLLGLLNANLAQIFGAPGFVLSGASPTDQINFLTRAISNMPQGQIMKLHGLLLP